MARTGPETPGGAPMSRGRSRHARPQSGFSLIEVLIALMLISVVVLAIAAGVLTLLRTTRATMERQQVQHGLANFGEALKAAPYLPCDEGGDLGAYESAYAGWAGAWTPPDGMTTEIVDVEHWDRDSQSYGACAGEDQGAQQLTLEVTWRNRIGTAQIVKGSR